jgi:hypothetical protein
MGTSRNENDEKKEDSIKPSKDIKINIPENDVTDIESDATTESDSDDAKVEVKIETVPTALPNNVPKTLKHPVIKKTSNQKAGESLKTGLKYFIATAGGLFILYQIITLAIQGIAGTIPDVITYAVTAVIIFIGVASCMYGTHRHSRKIVAAEKRAEENALEEETKTEAAEKNAAELAAENKKTQEHLRKQIHTLTKFVKNTSKHVTSMHHEQSQSHTAHSLDALVTPGHTFNINLPANVDPVTHANLVHALTMPHLTTPIPSQPVLEHMVSAPPAAHYTQVTSPSHHPHHSHGKDTPSHHHHHSHGKDTPGYHHSHHGVQSPAKRNSRNRSQHHHRQHSRNSPSDAELSQNSQTRQLHTNHSPSRRGSTKDAERRLRNEMTLVHNHDPRQLILPPERLMSRQSSFPRAHSSASPVAANGHGDPSKRGSSAATPKLSEPPRMDERLRSAPASTPPMQRLRNLDTHLHHDSDEDQAPTLPTTNTAIARTLSQSSIGISSRPAETSRRGSITALSQSRREASQLGSPKDTFPDDDLPPPQGAYPHGLFSPNSSSSPATQNFTSDINPDTRRSPSLSSAK